MTTLIDGPAAAATAVPRVRLSELDLADVAMHRRGIWRYLRFLGCDEAAADDLTQETFLALSRGSGNGEAVRDPPAYLRGVARKLFLGWLRRNRREPSVENISDLAAADLDAADEVWSQFAGEDGGDAWIEALRECVERLQGRGRQAIELHYRDDQSREQIARSLDMMPEGVKTLLRRTRAVLRECVERKMRSER